MANDLTPIIPVYNICYVFDHPRTGRCGETIFMQAEVLPFYGLEMDFDNLGLMVVRRIQLKRIGNEQIWFIQLDRCFKTKSENFVTPEILDRVGNMLLKQLPSPENPQ